MRDYDITRFADKSDPIFNKPFVLKVGSARWSIATDRMMAVCVRGPTCYKPLQHPGHFGTTYEDHFTSFLSESVPKDAVKVSVGRLLSWAGQSTDPGTLVGKVIGISIDVRRLSSILEDVPFQDVVLWGASKGDRPLSLRLAYRNYWRAFLGSYWLQDSDVFDIEDFDCDPDRTLFDLAMAGD